MSRLAEIIREKRRGFCSVVVVAAGESRRFGKDKLFAEIGGVPVIQRTLEALASSPAVDEIVVVTRQESLESIAGIVDKCGISKVSKIVIGGADRTRSALAGVSETSPEARTICIHDGARPFVTHEVIAEVIAKAGQCHAACPAIPVKDTVRIAENGVAVETPARERVYAVQTPQAFTADIIKAALTAAVRDGESYTDDCAAAEALGVKIGLTCGDERNIKITTALDIPVAEFIAGERNRDL